MTPIVKRIIIGFVIIFVVGWAVRYCITHLYNMGYEAADSRCKIATVSAQNEQNRVIANNALQSLRLFNMVSEANKDAKDAMVSTPEVTEAEIKKSVLQVDWLDSDVPESALNWLRENANRIRSHLRQGAEHANSAN